MRNWNTIGRVRRKFTRRGFQTTYEELKHNPRRDLPLDLPLPDYLWGIETDKIMDSVVCRRRFQTTYEELKHRYLNMYRSGDPRRLPDYLWGIETSVDWMGLYFIYMLPDYLWGIETHVVVDNDYLRRIASRLPMRNWNSICQESSWFLLV